MSVPFINLQTQYQSLKAEINRRIDRVLEHGQYILGPEVDELEEKLASFVGAKHCITVASGTDALLISLMAIGLEPGDEVITTPFTFVATAEVIALLGAKPIFVDIEPDTCNIDSSLIEAKITSKTKAIIPVSLYGQPANLEEINLVAEKYGNIPVIEDAAQSFGAEYQDKKSCNLSTIGCTSFFPSKPLGCYGDGGAIFTSDDQLAQIFKQLRVHGQSERYVHTRIGVAGRMDSIQCGVLLAKLDHFDWEIQQRHEIGARYNAELDRIGIERVQQKSDRTSVFAQYTLMHDDRENLKCRLGEAGIPTAIHYPVPINEQPAYKKFCCPDCTPVAKRIAKQVVSLPMDAYLKPTTQTLVVKELERALR